MQKLKAIVLVEKQAHRKTGVNTGKYVTSFIGIATIEEPKAVVLVTLYDPKGEGGHSGGAVGAPVAGNIFREILEYLK